MTLIHDTLYFLHQTHHSTNDLKTAEDNLLNVFIKNNDLFLGADHNRRVLSFLVSSKQIKPLSILFEQKKNY